MKVENNSATVSVILASFDAGEVLQDAVNSVVSQNLGDWELIIINDGSTDQSAEYLDAIDSDSVCVIHQPNLGVSAARNAGLEIASGKYITFLDADDALPPNSLKVRADYLDRNPDIDVVDGIVSVRDERLKTELRRYQPYYRGLLLPRLLKLDARVFFNVCYMFRREALGNMRFPEHMTHAEDLAFFMKLADWGELTYGHVDEEVYHYRATDSSAMANMAGLERGYLQLIEVARGLRCASRSDIAVLKAKVAKILLLSWNARADRKRSVQSAWRALRA